MFTQQKDFTDSTQKVTARIITEKILCPSDWRRSVAFPWPRCVRGEHVDPAREAVAVDPELLERLQCRQAFRKEPVLEE